jgi:hypothetical protein
MKNPCPDVEDCLDAPEDITDTCPYDAICGKCEYYAVVREAGGLLMGRCLKKPNDPLISCKDEICHRYIIRGSLKEKSEQLEVLNMDRDELKEILKEVLDEAIGISDIRLGEKWKGGEMILRPGTDGLKEKSIPLENFFHKIVMLRDRLRVLEQKINSNKGLSDEDKVEVQQYITRMYGSLTSFNILFADKADHFVGEKS